MPQPILVVFANAGGGSFAPLGAITEKYFDQVFNVNVKGLLFTVQKALPWLKDGGAIILNASIVASIGMEAFSVYSATKAAVRSFARTWIGLPAPAGRLESLENVVDCFVLRKIPKQGSLTEVGPA
jgi:NAD(P)-dependent dehydrogenase (short-subunit alcohol dehydrogenase family)